MKLSRISKKISLGDYVLASKYRDCDPQDPWRVGYVVKIVHTWKREIGYVIGEHNGTWSDEHEYRHCRKITPEFAKEWLEFHGSKSATSQNPEGKDE